jgi:hypothetical protein
VRCVAVRIKGSYAKKVKMSIKLFVREHMFSQEVENIIDIVLFKYTRYQF